MLLRLKVSLPPKTCQENARTVQEGTVVVLPEVSATARPTSAERKVEETAAARDLLQPRE